MNPALQILAVAAVAFVSTSVDNLGVLVALFAAHAPEPRRVALGYLLASGIVIGIAWATSKAADLAPTELVGWLGVVPLALGIREARRAWWGPGAAVALPRVAGGIGVAFLTLAQSADNLLVFAALFGDTAARLDLTLFTALVAASGGWCALAFWLARHSPLAGPLQRAMRLALPLLLIGVGLYVLGDTVTDAFESRAGGPFQ